MEAERASTGAEEFPVTHWSLVAGIRHSKTMTRRQAFESLCQRYWKPVYHFARRAWSKSDDGAKDLTQSFFLWLMESGPLEKYAPDRGGFRKYLKSLLRHFAADEHDRERAQKRGGRARKLALDWGEAPLGQFLPDGRSPDPEEVFDLAWKKEVLDRSLERARQWFSSRGKEVQFQAFDAYELDPGPERPTYAAVAARLGVKESDVRNYLFDVRERIRAEIRSELSQTVADAGQLEDEWRDLFGK